MKTINKKLDSQSGVTILFAMLLFLVATVVSMVIIVAATSNVKRESSFKGSIQRNIELDSCSIMLREKLTGTFTFNEVSGTYICNENANGDEFKKLMIGISTFIMNSKDSTINSDWHDGFVLTSDKLNELNCKYKISSKGTHSYLVSLELNNGSIMYSCFNVEIDSVNTNKLKWAFDKSTFKKEGA